VLSELRLSADARGDDKATTAIAVVAGLLDDRYQDLREQQELPALVAAEVACEALLGLVDLLHRRAPEHLR
jgi:hypothetical protein